MPRTQGPSPLQPLGGAHLVVEQQPAQIAEPVEDERQRIGQLALVLQPLDEVGEQDELESHPLFGGRAGAAFFFAVVLFSHIDAKPPKGSEVPGDGGWLASGTAPREGTFMNMRTIFLHMVFVLAASASLQAQSEDEPRPVATVDLERYAGLWYEIARIPNRFQNDCVGAATATYELRDDGRIDVINRCTKDDGKTKEARGVARLDEAGGARLQVSFFSILGWRPVWGDYWILDLGEDYEYSVVGEGSRKYGWILSRSPTLEESQLAALFESLRSQGYDPAAFEVFEAPAPASME